jgi:hypothetical protein
MTSLAYLGQIHVRAYHLGFLQVFAQISLPVHFPRWQSLRVHVLETAILSCA